MLSSRRECSRRLTEIRARTWVLALGWALMGLLAWWAEFFAVWLLLLVIFLVWANLGSRSESQGPSAYSVFNPGVRALPGDLSSRPYEAMLRGGLVSGDHQQSPFKLDSANIRIEERPSSGVPRRRYEGPPVGRNVACPCGSGQKYKKCCGAPERLDPHDLDDIED